MNTVPSVFALMRARGPLRVSDIDICFLFNLDGAIYKRGRTV